MSASTKPRHRCSRFRNFSNFALILARMLASGFTRWAFFPDGGFPVNLGAIPSRRSLMNSLSYRQKNGAEPLSHSHQLASFACWIAASPASRFRRGCSFKPLLLFRVPTPKRLLYFPFPVSKHRSPQQITRLDESFPKGRVQFSSQLLRPDLCNTAAPQIHRNFRVVCLGGLLVACLSFVRF
jgi:hypothetical protein